MITITKEIRTDLLFHGQIDLYTMYTHVRNMFDQMKTKIESRTISLIMSPPSCI